MTFWISFDVGNAAFDEDSGYVEYARILREVADKMENNEKPPFNRSFFFVLFDINGNRVGTVRFYAT